MRDDGAIDSKDNTGARLFLTSKDIMAHNPQTMEQTQKPIRNKQSSGYPLRFRSKAQKKRLEDAAKKQRKTLKDFLIDLGEKAAAEMQRDVEVAS